MQEKCAESAIKYHDKHFPPIFRKTGGQVAGLKTVVCFQKSPDCLDGLCLTFILLLVPRVRNRWFP